MRACRRGDTSAAWRVLHAGLAGEGMVDKVFVDPSKQRLVHAAGGPGTFPFWRCGLLYATSSGRAREPRRRRAARSPDPRDRPPPGGGDARARDVPAGDRPRAATGPSRTDDTGLPRRQRAGNNPPLLAQGGTTTHTSDGMELFDQELHFPEGVLVDPGRFDRFVAELAERATPVCRFARSCGFVHAIVAAQLPGCPIR
jgi:hypothetical protein